MNDDGGDDVWWIVMGVSATLIVAVWAWLVLR